jgi:peptide/nickel transport system permease protein
MRFVVWRLVQAIFVVLGVASVVFLLLRLSGDPVMLLVSPDATQEQIELVRERYGFNEPLYLQYIRFLRAIAAGDFGESIRFKTPALELVLERLPATIQLALLSFAMTLALGIPAGVIAAVKRGTLFDNFFTVVALLGQSVPTFWLGVMLIILFAVQLRVLPTSGRGGLEHLVLPSFSLGAYSMARIARITRSSMLDVLGEDYIRTARAKGLVERAVVYRHAVKNASISIVTVAAYTFAALMSGAVITEAVFAWPGVGRLLVDAVYNRDYPVAQAAVFVIALMVSAINLLTDLTYAYIDPRIRIE